MHTRTQEFRDITDRLGINAEQVAAIVGRSPATVRQYRSAGGVRLAPDDVMDTLRTHWRGQLRARLERAVADMQDAGIAIEIGYGPVMQKAVRERAAESRFVDDFMVLAVEWR